MEMLCEEVQPSVRLFIEWMTSLLLLRNARLRRHLWENLERGSTRKAACLCSLHSIIMHMARFITNPSEKVLSFFLNIHLELGCRVVSCFEMSTRTNCAFMGWSMDVLTVRSFSPKDKLTNFTLPLSSVSSKYPCPFSFLCCSSVMVKNHCRVSPMPHVPPLLVFLYLVCEYCHHYCCRFWIQGTGQ